MKLGRGQEREPRSNGNFDRLQRREKSPGIILGFLSARKRIFFLVAHEQCMLLLHEEFLRRILAKIKCSQIFIENA